MFDAVLIANRGAIACRIQRSLRALGVRSVAVYAEADYASRHVSEADQAISLGDGPAADTYLRIDKLLAAARDSGAGAIHPGYGFLSENAEFAQAVEDAGLAFCGPTPEQIRAFGLKHRARALAARSAVPLLPGSGLLADLNQALAEGWRIGYPLMLKSTAGGGGIGMRVCRDVGELQAQFETVRRLGENHFRDGGLFLERYIERARHIEVQVFGDGSGEVIALGERDCSIQRRQQKVIEETPAPNLPDPVRQDLHRAALALARSVSYRSAGTVEFVYDEAAAAFYFLEVNARLQVEHGVTEQVFGVDLVRWMVELACGCLGPGWSAARQPRGHAIQARIYAEDPGQQFQPSPGLLTEVVFPAADGQGLRIDTWIEEGVEVPAAFDPLLAKVIAHADSREQALAGLDTALAKTRLYGVQTNRAYLRQILAHPALQQGRPWTRCLETLVYAEPRVEVLEPGTQTTVQDWPGRLGHWAVGIPPSGPMDDRSLRLGNRLLGNPEGAAALEITLGGPTLRFQAATRVAITGAELEVRLEGQPCAMNCVLEIPSGACLSLGLIQGAGCRAYLCVSGGLPLPDYLGSKSTFTLGQFGGHAGRALRAGDVLPLAEPVMSPPSAGDAEALVLPALRRLRVLEGPHAAPEFFTSQWMDTFYATHWEVHFNSSRTGIRLIGPKPQFARPDGGEAGLHPSNIHDNPYAVGAVDFTGDLPVILGPDGPSLGGFVCPATVIAADLWQLGQLKAGDRLCFVAVSLADARRAEGLTAAEGRSPSGAVASGGGERSVLLRQGLGSTRLTARLSGDRHLLLEFGEAEIDLATRFRVDALMSAFKQKALDGVVDVTPGIRSLQVHYQPQRLRLDRLLAVLVDLWESVREADDLVLESRIVHLPLSWDDPATRLAIDKYMTTVRRDAPWCPSNLEFIRRINGLESLEAVKRIVFEARYLVMGLGDVYLGAPVATPLDPRHRLVTTKYNPARTWTPENAVGIGGAYLCVYGMEGPGGYQFVGRTLQMWDRYQPVQAFQGAKHLLRFFDQIRFFEVSAEELIEIRKAFPLGRYPLKIEPARLSLADYQQFLAAEAPSIERFRAGQREAFAAERGRWQDAELQPQPEPLAPVSAHLAAGESGIYSPLAGHLWQLHVQPGAWLVTGQVVAVLEAMKMEIPVTATRGGRVRACFVSPGEPLRQGQLLLSLEAES